MFFNRLRIINPKSCLLIQSTKSIGQIWFTKLKTKAFNSNNNNRIYFLSLTILLTKLKGSVNYRVQHKLKQSLQSSCELLGQRSWNFMATSQNYNMQAASSWKFVYISLWTCMQAHTDLHHISISIISLSGKCLLLIQNKTWKKSSLLEESLLLTKVFLLAVRQNVSWLFPILSDYKDYLHWIKLNTIKMTRKKEKQT